MGAIGDWPVAVHRDDDWRPTRRDRVITVAAVGLFAATRLMHLGSFRLWFDEVFTFEAAVRDWGALMWFVRNYDVHPPLFYALAKLWVDAGGQSFVWLGLFPALTAIATLVPLYLLARALRLRLREFNLMVLLMAVNGYLTGYAQEFRAYNVLMFMAVTSLWLFVRYVNRERATSAVRAVLPLALVNLALVYTHYFGWLLVGVEGLFLLLFRRRGVGPFAVASAAAVAAYAPWAYAVVRAAAERSETGEGALFHIPAPNAFSVAFFYGALNGLFDVPRTTAIGVLLFAAPIALWWWRGYIGRTPDTVETRGALLLCTLVATVPVAIAFGVSQILPTAVWGQRHLIIVAAPYYLLVAVGLLLIPHVHWRRAAIAVTLAWSMAAGVWAQAVPYKTAAWDELVDYVIASTPPGQRTRIYAIDEDAAFPMQFYLRRSGRSDIDVAVMHEDTPQNRARFDGSGRVPYWALSVPVVLASDLRSLGDGPFWVCDDREDAAKLGRPGRSLPQVFRDAGYVVGPGKSSTLINRRWTARTVTVLPVSRSAAQMASAPR